MARRSEQEMINESRRAGRLLAQAFQNGATPEPVGVRLALQRGEFCVGEIPVIVQQFLEGDGSYTKRSGGWMIGGGVFGAVYSAVNLTSNAVGNAARRSKAARQTAGQWRQVGSGTVYLTDRRWSMQTGNTWHDLWFSDVRASDCDGKMIILEMAGIPRTGLTVPAADYWYVMFNKMAYDRVVMPPPEVGAV
jgi:hypothetical protein